MQSGFRKQYSTEHCHLIMLEKLKKSLEEEKDSGALLNDLLKAFDWPSLELLNEKLHTHDNMWEDISGGRS